MARSVHRSIKQIEEATERQMPSKCFYYKFSLADERITR